MQRNKSGKRKQTSDGCLPDKTIICGNEKLVASKITVKCIS